MNLSKFPPPLIFGMIMGLCACSEDTFQQQDNLKEAYTKDFIKTFGLVDEGHTWNMARTVTATVSGTSGNATVFIYDRMPGGSDCHLCAKFSASQGSFSFDYPSGEERLYVKVKTTDGKIIYSGGVAIKNDRADINIAAGSRAESTSSIPTYSWLSASMSSQFGRFFNTIESTDYNTGKEYSDYVIGKKPTQLFELYGLVDDRTGNEYWGNFSIGYVRPNFDEGREYSCKDLAPLVGANGVFNERVNIDCNLMKYWDELKPSEGAVYKPDGSQDPVTVEFMYGCANYKNTFGYFFYKDSYTKKQILSCPKYVLSYDASVATNLLRKAPGDSGFSEMTDGIYSGINAGMTPEQDIKAYETAAEKGTGDESNVVYKSSKYTIVFYPQEVDPDNQDKIIAPDLKYDQVDASLTIPEEYRIGFFILADGYTKLSTSTGTISNNSVRFSIPWMNQAIGQKFDTNLKMSGSNNSPHTSCNAVPPETEPCWFVTYKYDGEIVMGFEDGDISNGYGVGSDHDMNDMLFKVSGVDIVSAQNDDREIAEKAKMQSWIVACEDLGSTGDYDFNDVVFGVSHVATDSESKLYVRPLAAGGTLPVKLCYNGTPIDGRFWNEYFGESAQEKMINTTGSGGELAVESTVIEISDGVSSDYRLSTSSFRDGGDMGGFSVQVYKSVNDPSPSTTVSAPALGEAPQMILLPANWSWPRETVSIQDAYSGIGSSDEGAGGFAEWCRNKGYTSWTQLGYDSQKLFINNWRGEEIPEEILQTGN